MTVALTHEELSEMFFAGDFKRLSREALNYVDLTIARLVRTQGLRVNADLKQQICLVACEAAASWDPLRSVFGSWVEVVIRQEVQNHILRERARGLTGLHGVREEKVVHLSLNAPPPSDDGLRGNGTDRWDSYLHEHALSPAGHRSADDSLIEAEKTDEILALAQQLRNPEEQAVALWMLGAEGEPATLRGYCSSTGVSYRTAQRKWASAAKRIYAKLSKEGA